MISSVSVGAVNLPINQNLSPKEAFFSTLKSELDDHIGNEIFVPLFNAILRDCNVLDWKSEGINTYRLTLDSAYEAAREDLSSKTWQLEKEIVFQFSPEDYRIIFPQVMSMYENGDKIDPSNKSLNAIWAWESHLGYIYTGVGYSLRWDNEEEKIISDNINDAPWFLQSLATPRIKTLEESIQEWNNLGRERTH